MRIKLPDGREASIYGLSPQTIDISAVDSEVVMPENHACVVCLFAEAITNGINITPFGESAPRMVKLPAGWNFVLISGIHYSASNDVTELTLVEVL